MNTTEANPDNTSPIDNTEGSTQVTPPVAPSTSSGETPTPAQNPSSQQLSKSSPSSSGLTSFPTNEPSSMNTSTPSSDPVNNIAQKEVVTRPLLWGIVTFLFFTGLVIGGVSMWRIYREQNPISSNTSEVSSITTDSTTAPDNSIDTVPVTANPSIQADAIDAEIQAIDTDIEGDALSDSSLGL